ncbi:MYCBP-associated protein [Xyrichtys novacula]|uniref:MYCBP-associated protein n=1 Tax=Xyrichtys novacula TaxID=13765 RepID=A0AAV1EWA3_XYRNO|nr:MYCBP-associated protein [Xyrichtys novacula]
MDPAQPADPAPKLLDFPGLRLDEQGMLVPHSILGTVEGLRNYLESIGETELLKRIPAPQRDPVSEAMRWPNPEAARRPNPSAVHGRSVISSSVGNIESNALQNWEIQMRRRRQQQDFLADLLGRPVENLVMNQASSVRETQKQRESLNQATPFVHSRYGHHVGSEFWRLPPHYGDEMSGITATLTQTEQGRREPVVHVGQPRSILRESGLMCNETPGPTSPTQDQKAYQCQELREVLEDINIKKPDISGLEVIGSCKPFTHEIVCRSPSIEKEEEEEKEQKKTKENLDPPAQHEDVHSGALCGPALRFCGQLARWTGNSDNKQGEVGISVTVLFEALTEEVVFTDLELHNEGSTAIYYSWKRICTPNPFPNLLSHRRQHFYFNSSSGVILPGDTKQVEVIFKSVEPGIKTEMWQLKTHPLLLEGASMQVNFRGIALDQDKTADQRRFIEDRLEKRATEKMCRPIVDQILVRVFLTVERPSSLAEVYITEEQRFLSKNPKLHFVEDTVENLKKLWQEVNPSKHTWDLSVDTLRQAVVAQPDLEAQGENLARLNSLYLQLCRPPVCKKNYCTAAPVGWDLWIILLERMDDEARRLRNILGLPQRTTWDVAVGKDEMNEKEEGAAAKKKLNRERSTFKKDKQGKQTLEDEVIEDPEVYKLYRRLQHRKVYALVEDLVLNMHDVWEDLEKKN